MAKIKTTWRVTEVKSSRYDAAVTLERVDFYKPNPRYNPETDDPNTEFLDVKHTDPNAEMSERGEFTVLHNIDGFHPAPDTLVVMELTIVE